MIKSKMFILSLFSFLFYANTQYEPKWDSLDKRPIPSWYDKAKIGIFIHWGVFSVPTVGSAWFWARWKDEAPDFSKYIRKNRPKHFSYQEFAKEFKAVFFNPEQWSELLKNSGAKYLVFTGKHHDGFTLWPSTYAFSWNAKDIGPHRDLVGELSKVAKDAGLKFGLYYSLDEWFNPLYLFDKSWKLKKKEYVTYKLIPEMKELIKKYKPEIWWSDGDGEAYDSYWNTKQFLAWLYNESPVKDTIVVNDRWGIKSPCNHGGFYTCYNRYNPGTSQGHKWENAMTLDKKSWGFRRNAPLRDYLTIQELLKTLAETISCGGNILINIGPTKDGIIIPIIEERLLDFGKWLEINGEAIYESQPWTHQNDSSTSNIWYTQKSGHIFAIILDWPSENNTVTLGSASEIFVENETIVGMLGSDSSLKWNKSEAGIEVAFPDISAVKSEYAWVLKIGT